MDQADSRLMGEGSQIVRAMRICLDGPRVLKALTAASDN
jgi:hypothetical protein